MKRAPKSLKAQVGPWKSSRMYAVLSTGTTFGVKGYASQMMLIRSASGISPSTYGFAMLNAMSLNDGSGFLLMNELSSFGKLTGMYKPPVAGFIPPITAVLKSVFTLESLVSV